MARYELIMMCRGSNDRRTVKLRRRRSRKRVAEPPYGPRWRSSRTGWPGRRGARSRRHLQRADPRRQRLLRMTTAQDVQILVVGILADSEVVYGPLGAGVGGEPLGREEGGAPLRMPDTPVARLAELVGEPEPAAVQRLTDPLELSRRALADAPVERHRLQPVRRQHEPTARSGDAAHLL